MLDMYGARTRNPGNNKKFGWNDLPNVPILASQSGMFETAETASSRKKDGSRMVTLPSEEPRVTKDNGDILLQRSWTLTRMSALRASGLSLAWSPAGA